MRLAALEQRVADRDDLDGGDVAAAVIAGAK
jgi:hypothetical protein